MLDIVTKNRDGLALDRVIVTPEIARAWLDKNFVNRNIRARFVSVYARDMINGDWQMTGDAIRFDTKNNLIDGQHRLLACIEANANFETMVIYGCKTAVRDVIDTGAARSNGDTLTILGCSNANIVGSILKLMINIKCGMPIRGQRSAVSKAELMDAYRRHPNISMFVVKALPRGISLSNVSLVNYIGAKMLKEKGHAAAMVNVLKTGIPAYVGDPIHAYRERLLTQKDTHTRNDNNLWTLIDCWNKFIRGENTSRISWKSDNVGFDGLDTTKL